ncbi:secretory carrier-associated membrane protein 5 [Corchorus olitorius]|uniref:Secretory carrier-associated membrane protein 5 n=1 Tax=Corchorus olitorius TaxID=93759 RepID=A0A1R3GHC5_9ROSI|nr:secretory carrier-associated membrane protein 5 [Corchorus olitorius]
MIDKLWINTSPESSWMIVRLESITGFGLKQYVASTACHHNTSKLMVPTAPPARLSPLSPEPAGFNYDREANIPLDNASGKSQYQDLKKKERELQAKEADLRRRE